MRRKTFDRLIVALMVAANLPLVAALLWAFTGDLAAR
jgi:hypothetical protein